MRVCIFFLNLPTYSYFHILQYVFRQGALITIAPLAIHVVRSNNLYNKSYNFDFVNS